MRPRFALLALLAAGCGGDKVAPVSGRVTLDGKPLADAHVGFQPMAEGGKMDAGGGSYAITDADGKYTLRLVESDRAGAVVGKHRVEINIRGQDDDTDRRGKGIPRPVVPPRYNRDSELTRDVPSGGAVFDFDLTSGAKGK